jgi:hypothetical protein
MPLRPGFVSDGRIGPGVVPIGPVARGTAARGCRRRVDPAIDRRLLPGSSMPPSAGWREGRRSAWSPHVAAFRAALIADIRGHRLAWSVIVAGAMASAMLWGSISGLPLARPASFDVPAASPAAVVESNI